MSVSEVRPALSIGRLLAADWSGGPNPVEVAANVVTSAPASQAKLLRTNSGMINFADDLTLLWAKADQCYVDEMHAVILVQV